MHPVFFAFVGQKSRSLCFAVQKAASFGVPPACGSLFRQILFVLEAVPDVLDVVVILEGIQQLAHQLELVGVGQANEQEKLLTDIEIPLAKVLAKMENIGFAVDRQGIEDYKYNFPAMFLSPVSI